MLTLVNDLEDGFENKKEILGYYTRVRPNKKNKLTILENHYHTVKELLTESIYASGSIKGVQDNRKYYGEFTEINGILLYKNMIVTKGTIEFRNKKYQGLEFLSQKQENLKENVEEFLIKINDGNKNSIKNYNISPIRAITYSK